MFSIQIKIKSIIKNGKEPIVIPYTEKSTQGVLIHNSTTPNKITKLPLINLRFTFGGRSV